MTKTYPKVFMSPMFLSGRKKIRKNGFFRSLEGTVPLNSVIMSSRKIHGSILKNGVDLDVASAPPPIEK